MEENALNHASSFSSRNKELGNGVQKEGKTRKSGISERKMQASSHARVSAIAFDARCHFRIALS